MSTSTTREAALTAADVREIAATVGFQHAEYCVEQAESQGDASEARAELNRLFNEQALKEPGMDSAELAAANAELLAATN